MTEFFAHPGWQRLLLALLHSAWVIALVGGALWLTLRSVRNPRTRYAVELAGLATFAVLPALAWVFVDVPRTTPERPSALVDDDGRGDFADAIVTSAGVSPSDGESSSRTTSPAATSWLDRLRPWLLAAWLSGVGLFTVRLMLGLVGVTRLLRGCEPLPERLVGRVRRLRRRLEIPASVVVAGSRRVVEAMAVGFVRPVVLVPTSWLTSMPTAVLEAIVAHELAHVRRWDLWVNLLQRVLETLLFFHPVVWWLSGRVRVDRELCCDALAARATGKRVLYARALEYVAIRRVEAATPLVAAGWGGTKMRLLERVKNVLGVPGTAGRTGWWPLAVVAVALGTAAWFGGPAVSAAVADDEERVERRNGDRERGEREERREGDRERGEREERRDGDRERGEREVRRDGDRDRERGEREERRFDGDRERFEREERREGDRERERRFDGEREREGDRPRFRDGDRPRFEGERDRPFREVERPRFREGEIRRPDGEVGELIDIIRGLRREVEELRREVHEIRERRPERERPRFGENELRERLRRELEERREVEELERREQEELEELRRDREREFGERRRDREREFDEEREELEELRRERERELDERRERFEAERRRFERERDEEEREEERSRRDRDEDEEEERREREDEDEERRDRDEDEEDEDEDEEEEDDEEEEEDEEY